MSDFSDENQEGANNFLEEEAEYDDLNQDYEFNDDIRQVSQEVNFLMKDIKNSYENIFSTLTEIQLMKNRYTILKNTISSLQMAPIAADGMSGKSSRFSARSSQSGVGEGQISSNHQLKINGKKKDIANLEDEIDRNQNKTYQSLEDRLTALLEDERDAEINYYIDAGQKLTRYKINSENNRLWTEFYQNQIKERKKELKELRILKADAEKSLGILIEREKKCFFVDNKEDSEKMISSLQDELVKLETQMQSVRKRIYIFKENTEYEMVQYQENKLRNTAAANWEEEKATLTNTLNDLKQKVRILKQHQVYYPSEAANSVYSPSSETKIDSLTSEERDMYGSILRKYSNSMINKNSIEPSDNFGGSSVAGSILSGSGSYKYSDSKIADNYNLIMEPRIKLAKLMDENTKSEKLLARKKEMFNLIIEKFRKREKDLIVNSPKIVSDFQEQERQLLDKIHKLKIKLAQERLNNEKK